MWEWLSLVVTLWLALFRGRHALLLENLLLRQQLAVALRSRRRPRVRWHDRLWDGNTSRVPLGRGSAMLGRCWIF